jgi:hypothetical protein
MADSVRSERLTTFRINQLRQSIKGYRDMEKVAAEFRARAAMAVPARVMAMRLDRAVVGRRWVDMSFRTLQSDLPAM